MRRWDGPPPPQAQKSPAPDDDQTRELRDEIAQRRDNLDHVIDEITHRLQPRNLVHEVVAGARRSFETDRTSDEPPSNGKAIAAVAGVAIGSFLLLKAGAGFAEFLKKNPGKLAIAAGAGAFVWWRLHDQRSLQQRARIARDAVRHQADHVRDVAWERIEGARETVRQALPSSEHRVYPRRPGESNGYEAHAAERRLTRQIDETRAVAAEVEAQARPAPTGQGTACPPAATPAPEPRGEAPVVTNPTHTQRSEGA